MKCSNPCAKDPGDPVPFVWIGGSEAPRLTAKEAVEGLEFLYCHPIKIVRGLREYLSWMLAAFIGEFVELNEEIHEKPDKALMLRDLIFILALIFRQGAVDIEEGLVALQVIDFLVLRDVPQERCEDDLENMCGRGSVWVLLKEI